LPASIPVSKYLPKPGQNIALRHTLARDTYQTTYQIGPMDSFFDMLFRKIMGGLYTMNLTLATENFRIRGGYSYWESIYLFGQEIPHKPHRFSKLIRAGTIPQLARRHWAGILVASTKNRMEFVDDRGSSKVRHHPQPAGQRPCCDLRGLRWTHGRKTLQDSMPRLRLHPGLLRPLAG